MAFRLNFSPKVNGWHFQNNFVNNVVSGVITTYGLCGGMAATAWDYWAAGLPIPSHLPEDFPDGPGGWQVPAEGTRLRQYIYDRQMATLGIPFHLSRWIIAGDLSRAERFRKEVREEEFPKLRRRLEGERAPGIVGLFSPEDGNPFGHQVLAYGFDDSEAAGGIGIFVYDSNHPGQEVLIVPANTEDGHKTFELRIDGRVVQYYRKWFFMDYAYDINKPVRPPYQDLVVTAGPRVEEARPQVGAPLHLSYTVTNRGEFPAHLDELRVWVTKDGARRDDLAGGADGNPAPIPPGGTRSIRTGTNAASGPAGAYRAGASYRLAGVDRNLPGTSGSPAVVDFGLMAGAAPATGWRDLAGTLTSDVGGGCYADGRVAAFGVGLDGRVWHRVQARAGAYDSWADWAPIGDLNGCVGRPTVARSVDNRLEVFVRRTNGELWHVWQTAQNGGWSGWEKRGDGCVSDAAVARNSDGRMELFVCRARGEVFHAYQRFVNSAWSGLEPFQNGSLLGSPAVAVNHDGRMEVAGRGLDEAIWQVCQTAPNNGWSPWSSLGGGLLNAPTIVRNHGGHLEVFATGRDARAWHIWQDASRPGGWSAWNPMRGTTVPADARYAADVNHTTGLTLYVRGTGGDILERHHVDREPWWSDWASLGGTTIGDPAVVRLADGKHALLTRGTARQLIYRYQLADGTWSRG